MSLFLIAPAAEIRELMALDLPVGLRSLDHENEGFSLQAETLTAETLALITLSSEGRKLLEAFAAHWQTSTDMTPPPTIVLSNLKDRRLQAQAALAPLLAEREAEASAHSAELLKSIAALRMVHEETARQVRSLGIFVEETLEKRRWLTQANGPLPRDRAPHLAIPGGSTLRQRLATSSLGLSDVAMYLPPQEIPECARLRASLVLSETGASLADWDLSADEIQPGRWLRLSLLETPGDDEQTPDLSLSWTAPTPLVIGGSMFHPDPDLCAEIAGIPSDRLLAHRLWKYIPNCRPPLPEDGHLPEMTSPGRFYVDPTRLAAAANAANRDLRYFPDIEALQVHPRENHMGAARLASAIRPGMSRVRAAVGGRHEAGPRIEYALVAAPPKPARAVTDMLAEAERSRYASAWLTLERDRMEDLTLVLPRPAEAPLDLWLLTRLAPGTTQAFGWATFRNIWLSA